MLTKEQKEKILFWSGYTKGKWAGWFDPKGVYLNGLEYKGEDGQYEPPNIDDLNILWGIINAKILSENYYI
jgi:hypothetical protein